MVKAIILSVKFWLTIQRFFFFLIGVWICPSWCLKSLFLTFFGWIMTLKKKTSKSSVVCDKIRQSFSSFPLLQPIRWTCQLNPEVSWVKHTLPHYLLYTDWHWPISTHTNLQTHILSRRPNGKCHIPKASSEARILRTLCWNTVYVTLFAIDYTHFNFDEFHQMFFL